MAKRNASRKMAKRLARGIVDQIFDGPRRRSPNFDPLPQKRRTYQFDGGDKKPNACVWINAFSKVHAIAYANGIGIGDWSATTLRTTRSPAEVDIDLDNHGRITHSLVTVKGGIAEHFDGPSTKIVDFDDLNDGG